MDREASHISDIRQMTEELEPFDEPPTGFGTSFDSEGQNGSAAPGQISLLAFMPWARSQTRKRNPFDVVARFKPVGDSGCILHMPFHPKAQCLEPLKKQE